MASARSKPIEQLAVSKTKKIAIGAALISALLAIPVSLVGSIGADYISFNKTFDAIKGQLIHSLEVGDEFQLKRIASSLVSSSIVAGASIQTADHRLTLAQEGKLLEGSLENPENLEFGTEGIFYHRSKLIENSAKKPIGYLVVTSTLSWNAIFMASLIGVLLMIAIHLYVAKILTRFSRFIVKPLSEFPQFLGQTATNEENAGNIFGILELDSLLQKIQEFRLKEREFEKLKLEAQSEKALIKLSKQVAHDIRSPLSTLNVVLGTTVSLPEQKRILARSAIKRINDIATNLLFENVPKDGSAESKTDSEISVHLLSSVLDELVSEKRIQFRSLLNVEIDYQPDAQSYGLFSAVYLSQFKRMLSNLINNAVEALPSRRGIVRLTLAGQSKEIVIEVSDNGKGIPAHILPQLGQLGKSFGKEGTESGSGLGLYHARTSVESWGGRFEIESTVGKGTTIRIRLPKAETPSWFVRRLGLPKNGKVVVVDDDASIHHLWDERFEKIRSDLNIEVLHFSTLPDVRDWSASQSSLDGVLFLVDYEFIGQTQNGLDLIQKMKIEKSAILVTSHNDEPSIMAQAESLGIRMIPKSIAGLVPIVDLN